MKINRNIIWAEIFFSELVRLGIQNVCIAPGSRSTPLIFAISNNPSIKPYVFIDERSCSFFALGLAKKTKLPVVLVCTSGTAVAEFYPAIIEAYQQRVPLIVCTADRPPELLNNGANQTINQRNIYSNHILWSFDTGLPEMNSDRLKNIKITAKRAIFECFTKNKGPVHINFSFRKPFEPDSFTDEIDYDINDILRLKEPEIIPNIQSVTSSNYDLSGLIKYISTLGKGIVITGPDNYFQNYSKEVNEFALRLKYPILADGASGFRYGNSPSKNIIVNFDAFLRSKAFVDNYQPEIIFQFGQTITSKGLESYLQNTNAKRFLINETGAWFDPYNNAEAVIKIDPGLFCNTILKSLNRNLEPNDDWINAFLKAENVVERLKENIINNAEFPFEGRIINEVISEIPEGSSVMISNSMPIRDLDYFASLTKRKIHIYCNRGTSGIDGIISTALGINASSEKPVFLITGDLAFYHDLNGLLAAKKYSLPIIIILINNNGGGIFQMLPVSNYKSVLTEYFTTSHNLDFSNFVLGYDGNYFKVKNWSDLHIKIQQALNAKSFSVLEIDTDAGTSVAYRKHYWNEVGKYLK